MDLLLPPTSAIGVTASGGADRVPVDLHDFYGRGWLDDGGVRVNFVSSVDGSIKADGLSRGLQTPGDNRVFGCLRDLADVVLVGASTAAAEGYRPIDLSEARRAQRLSLGLTELPAIAVVSAGLKLDLDAPLYRDARPESPTIIITGGHASINARTDIIDLAGTGDGVQLVEVGAAGAGVSFAGAVLRLRELGHRRILCEGGPRLFAAGLAESAVTELCLTISPMLVPTDGPGIVSADGWPPELIPTLKLIGLLTEDSALFCRYQVLQ